MAAEKIKLSRLTQWIEKYRRSLSDENETLSCLLSVAELRTLLAYVDTRNINETTNKIDGVRVYLTRPGDQNVRMNLKKPTQVGGLVDQLSIAIIPTYRYSENFEDSGKAGAFEYLESNGDDKIVYCVFPGGEHSGLCPPNCGGSQ